MPLSPGTRLGPYEIVGAIGAGGMGEVYRARDSRLHREVAIKVLPAALSADADRLNRFELEARAAAALNHPNILAVYDIGTERGAPFIVSELLEGRTLRERMTSEPLPVRKALAYIVSTAHGLSAAHGKGITHRDLKPENLFITADERAKILDFGLAKLTGDPIGASDDSARQTAAPATAIGAVIGTVGYMAPEQVRGQAVDHRADLFALGVILYEILSGSRPFRRDTAPETLAAILNEDPPSLAATGRQIPPALVRIVERCLEKNPAARFQTATDLAFALESVSEGSESVGAVAASPSRQLRPREWVAWTAVALLLLVLVPVVLLRSREQPAVARAIRFQIPPAVELAGPGNFAVSPDGGSVVFFGVGTDGVGRLWIRPMDSLEVRPLPGTEFSRNVAVPPPFWSPDSRFIAFQAADYKLKKLDVTGGLAQTLADVPGVAVGGSWNRDGDIIVGNTNGGLLRIRETGGAAAPLTTLDSSRKEELHLLPTFLGDGRHFVYLRISPSTPENSGTYVGTIDAAPDAQSAEPLMPYAVGLTYAPPVGSGSGHLLFVREGTLIAQPFDEKRMALGGAALPVADHVGSFRDGAFFSASANDVMVYRSAEMDFQVTLFDRQGTAAGHASEPGPFRGAALSPDATRAVATRTNPRDPAKSDLWLLDLSRERAATRFTFGDGLTEFPLWSPDGKGIVFTFNNNSLVHKLVSGDEDSKELLRTAVVDLVSATGWSPDGRFLSYATFDTGAKNKRLMVLPMDGRKPVPFARAPFQEDQGHFSPDGRWIAYVSDRSGAFDVYVRAFTTDFSGGSAGTGESVLVSRGGGSEPRWRGDAREIYYLAPDGKIMAVAVDSTSTFSVGAPTALFQAPAGALLGDVSSDGKRFLLVTPVGPGASGSFTVVLNWQEELKRRVAK